MLQSSSCTRILAEESTASLVEQTKSEMELQGVKIAVDRLPALKDVFPSLDDERKCVQTEVEPYPPAAQPVDTSKTALFVHSSGSTGYPKSVPLSCRRLVQWIGSSKLWLRIFALPQIAESVADVFGSSTDIVFGAMGLPTFHGMGLLLQLTVPLNTGQPVVVYTPQNPAPPVIAHAQNVYEVSKAAKCNAVFALPSYVEVSTYWEVLSRTPSNNQLQAWSHSPEIVEYLSTLDILVRYLIQPSTQSLSQFRYTEAGRYRSPQAISLYRLA
jgi:acyl-CoA synthetase (AMP-forming)/AMP-acid ligase II